MSKSLGNCGHYDDCRKCMCYGCKSTRQCGSCVDCTGSMSMADDPFTNYRESCDEFEPARKGKVNDEPQETESSGIHTDSAYFKDDMCRRHAKMSYKLSPPAREDIISKIKVRNSKYGDNFTSYQTARQDEIENAIFEMIKTVTCDDFLSWNMELIGDVADAVCETLSKKGFLIYYPSVTEDENGNFAISDFYGI